MKKALIIIMVCLAVFAFCSCGSSEEEPKAYTPTDIQTETLDDGSTVFSVIYDCTVEKDSWSGYPEDSRELETAINGIKECMNSDEWTDTSVVYGYAEEPLLKNALYSYEAGNPGIDFYQIGIYNTTYTLQGELD